MLRCLEAEDHRRPCESCFRRIGEEIRLNNCRKGMQTIGFKVCTRLFYQRCIQLNTYRLAAIRFAGKLEHHSRSAAQIDEHIA